MEECTEAEVQRMIPLVSAQRREQALRYTHTFGQFCCLKSWEMLMEGINDLGVSGLGDFCYNEHGKPYWSQGPFFSISHCKQGIAVAINERPIGIDIEAIRHAEPDLITRTMSKEEQEQIFRAADTDRAFTRFWTQKEAVVKAQGVGIESFEQLQKTLDTGEWILETIEKEKYIYSIAHK